MIKRYDIKTDSMGWWLDPHNNGAVCKWEDVEELLKAINFLLEKEFGGLYRSAQRNENLGQILYLIWGCVNGVIDDKSGILPGIWNDEGIK